MPHEWGGGEPWRKYGCIWYLYLAAQYEVCSPDSYFASTSLFCFYYLTCMLTCHPGYLLSFSSELAVACLYGDVNRCQQWWSTLQGAGQKIAHFFGCNSSSCFQIKSCFSLGVLLVARCADLFGTEIRDGYNGTAVTKLFFLKHGETSALHPRPRRKGPVMCIL